MTQGQKQQAINRYLDNPALAYIEILERLERLEKFESAYYRSLVSPESKAMIKKLVEDASSP